MSNYVANHERFNALCEKCKYPNLAAEIISHSYDYSTFAEHASITKELLMAFLAGEEELTEAEFAGLYRVLQPTMQFYPDVKQSWKYLFSERLSLYNTDNRKHRNKIHAMRARLEATKAIEGNELHVRTKEKKEIALAFCDERQGKLISRAAISTAMRAIDDIESDNRYEIYRRNKQRRRGLTKTA